nr:Gfo/Idh/MocA family oxidoreductase [uncultured Desulfobacter sp.]
MYHIIVIGAGRVGSRHVQALAKIDIPVTIQVVDPNPKALKIAEQLFYQNPENANITKITFLHSIQEINSDIDFGVIATNADVRLSALTELLKKIRVKYLLLEKVLFQSIADGKQAERLLQQSGIKAWVNCHRRMNPFYQKLKKELRNSEYINYNVVGGEWGLGCNAIHYLDHLAFLTEEQLISLNTSKLDKDLLKSKRPGFIEFTGTLTGLFSKGSQISLTAQKNTQMASTINIESEKIKIEIQEGIRQAVIKRAPENWAKETIEFTWRYQSDITQIVASSILKTQDCFLTPFKESLQLHEILLEAIRAFLNSNTDSTYTYCPIT